MDLWFIILLTLSISLVQSRSIKTPVNETSEETDNSNDEDYFTVSAIIEIANKNSGKSNGEFTIIDGDIAVYTGLQNADPCTSAPQYKCKWPKSKDGTVKVPFIISRQYSPAEQNVIQHRLASFQASTCIRFIPRTNEADYINIISGNGCYSNIGRMGGKQDVSLKRTGCIYHHIVQHEFLHALGFNHEQSRSDRDKHIRILFQNIKPDLIHNFDLVNTNNLNTPYDYNSVMQYVWNAFSKDSKLPTMIPIPDPSVPIGLATVMSHNDILRVNRLYC